MCNVTVFTESWYDSINTAIIAGNLVTDTSIVIRIMLEVGAVALSEKNEILLFILFLPILFTILPLTIQRHFLQHEYNISHLWR